MNLNNIIGEIEKADPEVFDRLDTRRNALKGFRNFSGKLALAAVPLAFGSMFKKAYAGTRGTNDVFEILNYALTLEYLEAEFYKLGLEANIITGKLKAGVQTIYKDEAAHVKFLQTAITAAGGTPVDKPKFDFSGGKGSGEGPFKTAFSDPDLFLAVAQTFEDTGVRAYKGRAAELQGGGDVLTAALQIHSVEARHAAYIRIMRKALGSGIGDVKPWITGNMSNINTPLVQDSYNGEESTTQAGINIVNINGMGITENAATEAFDEVLSREQVLMIVNPFFAV